MKVAIIGQGYVGLSLAMKAAKNHEVTGFDLDIAKIDLLKSGASYIEGVSASEISKYIHLAKFKPTSDPTDLLDQEVYVLAVPTPLNENRDPDLSFLRSAATLVSNAVKRNCLVINESTSYPGTLRNEIIPVIEYVNNGKYTINYASSPERVDPGNAKWNQGNTPRLVSGIDLTSTKLATDFYKTFCDIIINVSSPEVAEMAKLFENTFRQVNIALVNEFAKITEKFGLSANEVLDAANTKPFGFMRFNPGLGVGGHCIPVDPSYLSYIARKKGAIGQFIELANKVNLEMPEYIASRVKEILGSELEGKKVLVVGISYKQDIKDVRESPSIDLIKTLRTKGAIVRWHDEIVGKWSNETSSEISGSDITIIATIHKSMDLQRILKSSEIVFDCTGKVISPDVYRL